MLAARRSGQPSSASLFLNSFRASLFALGFSFLTGPFQIFIPKSMKQEHWQRTHQLVDAYIDRAIAEQDQTSQAKSYSLLGSLVQQTDDRIEIRNQILQGMMVAQDTTAVLLSNTVFLLSRHPKSWDRLRLEVIDAQIDFLQASSLKT